VFHKYLQAAFNGQLDAKAAMDTAQAEAEKILADYK
jgi:ABC-type glycerol-3-phosphate transport system substrate-binding protein